MEGESHGILLLPCGQHSCMSSRFSISIVNRTYSLHFAITVKILEMHCCSTKLSTNVVCVNLEQWFTTGDQRDAIRCAKLYDKLTFLNVTKNYQSHVFH